MPYHMQCETQVLVQLELTTSMPQASGYSALHDELQGDIVLDTLHFLVQDSRPTTPGLTTPPNYIPEQDGAPLQKYLS